MDLLINLAYWVGAMAYDLVSQFVQSGSNFTH